jgi:hypothetical protein
MNKEQGILKLNDEGIRNVGVDLNNEQGTLAGAKLKPCHFRVGLSDGILFKTLKILIDLLAFKI